MALKTVPRPPPHPLAEDVDDCAAAVSLSSLLPSLRPSSNPLFPVSFTLQFPDVAVVTIVFVFAEEEKEKEVSAVDAQVFAQVFAVGWIGEEGEEREEGEEGDEGVDEGRSRPEGE